MSLAKTCGDRGTLVALQFNPPGRLGSGLFGSGGAPDHTGVGIASSTRVLTRRGLVPAGELLAGDVLADGQGRWTTLAAAVRITTDIGTTRVRIAKGALGGGLPSSDIDVGPATRLRLRSEMAERLVGAASVLVSAKDLVGRPGITQGNGAAADIIHLMFEHHSFVLAEDVVVEAFVPDAAVLESMAAPHREQVLTALPKLRYESARTAYDAGAPDLDARETRQVLEAPSSFGADVGTVAVPAPATSAAETHEPDLLLAN